MTGLIQANENMNDYTTTGKYACESGATALTVANAPYSSEAYVMFVITIPNYNYTYQIAFKVQEPWDISIRVREVSTWSSWHRLYVS